VRLSRIRLPPWVCDGNRPAVCVPAPVTRVPGSESSTRDIEDAFNAPVGFLGVSGQGCHLSVMWWRDCGVVVVWSPTRRPFPINSKPPGFPAGLFLREVRAPRPAPARARAARTSRLCVFNGSTVCCTVVLMDTAQSTFSIRLPRELRERLEAAAKADRRPLGQLVRNVLADYAAWAATRQEDRAA
jgi:hypothetical protein